MLVCYCFLSTYNQESCRETGDLSVAGGKGFHCIKNLILVLCRRLALGNVEGYVPEN